MTQTISKWEGSSEDVNYAWRSKIYVLPSRKTFTCAKVIADSYPIVFQMFTDGTLRVTKSIHSRNAFRLPTAYECEEIEVRLIGTAKVNSVYVAETMDELRLT